MKTRNVKKIKKIYTLTTLILCIALAGIAAVNAWFTGKKSIETVSMVRRPMEFVLGAGHKEGIQRLDLGNIDARKEEHNMKYVFSVSSYDSVATNYVLQLSYTTNIKFDYKVYEASELETNEPGSIVYVGVDENYYYASGDMVQMQILNVDNNIVEFEKTYDEYKNVQEHAKPVYQISDSRTLSSERVDYYILEITWDEKEVFNDKETDMVYLMVF